MGLKNCVKLKGPGICDCTRDQYDNLPALSFKLTERLGDFESYGHNSNNYFENDILYLKKERWVQYNEKWGKCAVMVEATPPSWSTIVMGQEFFRQYYVEFDNEFQIVGMLAYEDFVEPVTLPS